MKTLTLMQQVFPSSLLNEISLSVCVVLSSSVDFHSNVQVKKVYYLRIDYMTQLPRLRRI